MKLRIDTGMKARRSPDLLKPEQPFKNRILVQHHPVDQVSGRTSFIVEQLDTIPEVKAIKRNQIYTVQLHRLFQQGTVLLGFGMPNVFLAKVLDVDNQAANESLNGDPVARFDARSLGRRESEIVTNKNGNDQVGFYIVPNLTPEEVKKIEDVARSEVGGVYLTCCRAISNILQIAGFTLGDGQVILKTWPADLLTSIIQRGLKLNGRDVDFMVVSTVRDPLSRYVRSIRKAQHTPITRYIRDALFPVSAKEQERRIERAKEMQLEQKVYVKKEPVVDSSVGGEPFEVEVSNPSAFGRILRSLWGNHAIYRIKLTEDEGRIVRQLLPESLTPFPVVKDISTALKKHILFAPIVTKVIASHHQSRYVPKGDFTVGDMKDLLPMGKKYNYVLTPQSLTFTPVTPGIVSWVLSKHLVLATGSLGVNEVKMSGEFWWYYVEESQVIDSHGDIRQRRSPGMCFNNNSGTFRPDCSKGFQMAMAIGRLFPSMRAGFEYNPCYPVNRFS